MREKADYRDNLEELTRYFGNKRLLTIKDVSEYCGRTWSYVKKTYEIDKDGITTVSLARKMCQ